jgi:SP family general alpha glucoside:H+ symporter-like MFS transporter
VRMGCLSATPAFSAYIYRGDRRGRLEPPLPHTPVVMDNNIIVAAANHNVEQKLDLDTIKDAAQADRVEHKQTIREAFHVHKKAIFWSMALSGALIMEGYDVVVIGSFYGQRECHPSQRTALNAANFLKRFGVEAPGSTNGYVIPAQWQSALSNGSSAGGIIGLLVGTHGGRDKLD